MELNGDENPFGAAHGTQRKINVHINLITGQIYHLKDLFKSESHYPKVLSEIIGKQIQQQKDFLLNHEEYQGIKENQHFFLTKDHLVIYFEPYEISAYAFGFVEFKVPYHEIKNIINEKGAFWQSFH